MLYQILACGSNGKSQLGIGNNEDQNQLQVVKFAGFDTLLVNKPVAILCGGNHTIILMENGDAYSSGDNSYGQCGLVGVEYVSEFTKIPGSGWVTGSCGWEFSILINKHNEIFACGYGMKGELGLGVETKQCGLTKVNYTVPNGVSIMEIKSSLNHSVMKMSNGQLVGWGNCRKGQLGRQNIMPDSEKLQPVIWEPRTLDFGIDISQPLEFAVGRDFTIIHFLASHQAQMFGKSFELEHVSNGSALKSMWSSVHFLVLNDERSSIKSFGNNSHGQHIPATPIEIERYEIGSEHGIILTPKNEVFAWGWGEHGNCGIHKRNDQEVTFDYLNPIYHGQNQVVLLGCGCATTWVVIRVE